MDEKTNCICYFGGDPTPQILHAVKTSKIALKAAGSRILRICWETNGSVQPPYLAMMADVSLASGGCIKFDLKAWDNGIHHALCGVTNTRTLENFQTLAQWTHQRPDPPFLIASTLLVPGYVDEPEVRKSQGLFQVSTRASLTASWPFTPSFISRIFPTHPDPMPSAARPPLKRPVCEMSISGMCIYWLKTNSGMRSSVHGSGHSP